ncbi:hypothetical protein KF840_08630 [bacterium]|nr:hypothetical protein [bacterium]
MRRVPFALVIGLICVPVLAGADVERDCRGAIDAQARFAVAHALRRLDACHRQRAGAMARCNDSQHAALAADLARLDARCGDAGAARAGYPGGDPAAALAALLDSEIVASGAALQGNLLFAATPAALACHAAIGRQRSQIVRSLLTRAIACQAARDADQQAPDSLAAACLPNGGAMARRAKQALDRACAGVDGTAIGSCAPLPDCAVGASIASARALAAALYGATRGTAAVFDLDIDLADPARFYDLPYPTDLRLRADGTPDLAAFPLVANPFVGAVASIADRRPAFPAVPVLTLHFDAPIAPRAIADIVPADAGAPLLLIDVDPASPDRGRLFPLIATTPPADPYLPGNALSVATIPGLVLPPSRRYAFVVRRGAGDATGAPLGVPLSMLQLRAGGTPPGAHGAAARALYAPLWETLDRIGIARDEVAAATVFSVGDVVAAFAAQVTALAARDPVVIENVILDAVHPRFCELRGTVRMPQYQRGTPPFATLGDFVVGADGLPIVQRIEDVPVVLTLPRQVMPAGGYPLTLYFHGSGGVAAQVVDRGPALSPGGEPVRGEGPAHVLAAHGIATAASALPLNPERLPGASSRAYLNLLNLAAYPYTFRQGTIEQRLLLDALGRLRIDAQTLVGCDGVGGDPAVRLRSDAIVVLGQSMGGQYANYFGALEPRVRAVIPTGSGGLWSLVVLEASVGDVDTRPLVGPVLLGTPAPLTHLHPGMALLETAWEWAEPAVYAPRIGSRPLPGHPARAIYQPVGVDDPEFPDPIYAAMAVASGTQEAGAPLEPLLPAALAAVGRGTVANYPVRDNVVAADGTPFTGVVAQYAGDGILISHHIAFQLDAVKFQYGCFAASALAGAPFVPAPAPLGGPCQ